MDYGRVAQRMVQLGPNEKDGGSNPPATAIACEPEFLHSPPAPDLGLAPLPHAWILAMQKRGYVPVENRTLEATDRYIDELLERLRVAQNG